jgi:hypothetical protein
LDLLYEDRLEGRISAAEYDQKEGAAREHQQRLRHKIQSIRATDLEPTGHAVDLMALASRAADLFLDQPASEQRKLLRLVVQEAFWKDEQLRMSFREPFEKLRLSNQASSRNPNDLGGNRPGFDNWRRKRDSNPRASYPANGFQDRRLQPLGHSSAPNLADCTPVRKLQMFDVIFFRDTRCGVRPLSI